MHGRLSLPSETLNMILKERLRKSLSPRLFHKLITVKNTVFPTKEYRQTREYEKRLFHFYRRFVQPGDLVFDVGANYGNRVKIFLQLKADVIAIEPQPVCVKFLTEMFGKKIRLVAKGLGDKEGTLDFYLSKDSTLSTFSREWVEIISPGRFAGSLYNGKISVPITTLDQMIAEYGNPAFIKVDVEGFEEQVISGLHYKIKNLSFEYIVPEKISSIIRCINHLGTLGDLEVNYSAGESLEMALEQWMDKQTFEAYLASADFLKSSAGDIYIRFNQ